MREYSLQNSLTEAKITQKLNWRIHIYTKLKYLDKRKLICLKHFKWEIKIMKQYLFESIRKILECEKLECQCWQIRIFITIIEY